MIIGTSSQSYDIRVVKIWDVSEIADLYREGGWWKESWNSDLLVELIQESFSFAIAVDRATGRAVGMGRVISDGISDGYVQDLVVHSGFRDRGIGQALLQRLLQECIAAHLTWIGCIAEPDTEDFYILNGFERMERYTPMLYRGDVPDAEER